MNFENPKSKTCCQPALLGLGARVLRNSHLVLCVGFCEDHKRGEGRRAAPRYRLVWGGITQSWPPTPASHHLPWDYGRALNLDCRQAGSGLGHLDGKRTVPVEHQPRAGHQVKAPYYVLPALCSVVLKWHTLPDWAPVGYLLLSQIQNEPSPTLPYLKPQVTSDLSTQWPPSASPAVVPSNSFPAPSHYPQSPSPPSQRLHYSPLLMTNHHQGLHQQVVGVTLCITRW